MFRNVGVFVVLKCCTKTKLLVQDVKVLTKLVESIDTSRNRNKIFKIQEFRKLPTLKYQFSTLKSFSIVYFETLSSLKLGSF